MTHRFPLRLREYFLLSQAKAACRRLPEAQRLALARGLRLARQHADSAESLWALGRTADALHLAVDAFNAALGATRHASGGGAAPGSRSRDLAPTVDLAPTEDAEPEAAPSTNRDALVWREVLQERGVPEATLRSIESARLAQPPIAPVFDDEVSPNDVQRFHTLVGLRRDIERALAPVARTSTQIGRIQATRLAGLAVALAALVTLVFMAVRTPHESIVLASAVYGSRSDFEPSNVIDDDARSEWLLPDGTPGWIEVRLSPPRSVSLVRLRNANNRNLRDRATKDYVLELYSGGQLIRHHEGRFDAIENTPQWTEIPVRAHAIDRIRVVVRSWHRLGGGLSEIDWDEE